MLLSLPTEVLEILTHFLNGQEIDLLWACGSRILNQKLYQPGAATSYYVQWDGTYPLTASAFVKRHPNLLSFEWHANAFAANSSIGNSRIWLQELPKSLVNLKLEGKDVFKAITGANTMGMEHRPNFLAKYHPIALNEHFPLLQHLSIISSIGFTSTFFYSLPSKLETLKLEGVNAALHEDSLPVFPETLKVFETDFVFSFSSRDHARVLPDTLESLGCSSWLESNFVELLPSHLKSLRILHVQSRLRDSAALNWRLMPQGLERLLINRKYFTPDEMSQLPRSLTYLMIDTSVILDDSFVPFLPPNLKKICMGHSVGIAEQWSNLPRSLIWLGDGPLMNLPTFHHSIGSSSTPEINQGSQSVASEALEDLIPKKCFVDLSCLPPLMTRVDLSGVDIGQEELSMLPKSVIRLKLKRLDDEMAPNLPPRLTYLCLNRDECTSLGVSKWPRSIQTLLLNHLAMIDSHSMSQMPPLRFLSLIRLSDSFDPILFTGLPPSLESLKIHACPQFMHNTLIHAITTGLTRLETLEISEDHSTSKISSDIFPLLPRSLKVLDICLNSEMIPIKSIAGFPRGLRSLKLQSPTSVDWSGPDFKVLPPNLVILEIPPSSQQLSKATINYLPVTLETLAIGQSTPFWWAMRASSQLQTTAPSPLQFSAPLHP